MDGVRVVHLGALCAWAAVVVVEGIIELDDRDDGSTAARLHYLIDLGLELPLLVAVLASGGILWSRSAPTPLLSLKIACGLAAVCANLVCVVFVVRRYRQRREPAARRRWSRLVRASIVGLPFALAAAFLGFSRFH